MHLLGTNCAGQLHYDSPLHPVSPVFLIRQVVPRSERDVFVILRARAKAVFISYGLDLAFEIRPAPSKPGKANRLGLFISGRGAPGMIESAKRLDQ